MTGKKILLIALIVLVVAGVIVGTVLHSRSDVPAVTTAKAVHGDLVSTVSGTGQIKPKIIVNVGGHLLRAHYAPVRQRGGTT